jgi:hypothetical protein
MKGKQPRGPERLKYWAESKNGGLERKEKRKSL